MIMTKQWLAVVAGFMLGIAGWSQSGLASKDDDENVIHLHCSGQVKERDRSMYGSALNLRIQKDGLWIKSLNDKIMRSEKNEVFWGYVAKPPFGEAEHIRFSPLDLSFSTIRPGVAGRYYCVPFENPFKK
jgi:hypothetical protein